MAEEEAKKEEKKAPTKKKKKKGGFLAKLFTFFLLLLIACFGGAYYAYDKKIITDEKILKVLQDTPIAQFIPQPKKKLPDYVAPVLQPIKKSDIKFQISMIEVEKINQELDKLLPLTVKIKKKEVPKEIKLKNARYLFLHEAKFDKIRKSIWAIRKAGGKITSCVVAGKTLVFVGPFYGVVQLQEFYSKFNPKYKDSIGKTITRDTYETLCVEDGRQLISLENDKNKKAK